MNEFTFIQWTRGRHAGEHLSLSHFTLFTQQFKIQKQLSAVWEAAATHEELPRVEEKEKIASQCSPQSTCGDASAWVCTINSRATE